MTSGPFANLLAIFPKMTYFTPEQSKLLSNIGLVSESENMGVRKVSSKTLFSRVFPVFMA